MAEFATSYFDSDFPDIGGPDWPFEKVYVARPEFVKFALCWDSATGNYGKFRKYCLWRKKISDATSTDP